MRTAAAVGLIAAFLLPGRAQAQGSFPSPQGSNPLSPFSPTPAPPPTTSTTPPILTPTSTSTSGGSLSSGDAVAIGIGALIVLGGISLFIWRDARRRAPVRARTAAAGPPGSSRQRQKSRKLSPVERRRRKRGRAR